MNNDFIQKLKEKRERYGVSQSRLAVCRRYLAVNIITALKTERHSLQNP